MESGWRNNIDRANRLPVCTKCENITIGDECQYIMECQHFSYFSNRFNITNIREKTNILKFKQEEFEDTKWVIRIRISKKNRQHKYKRTNNDQQNINIKLKIE